MGKISIWCEYFFITFQAYKIAKKTKNTTWKYFKLFEKLYGKSLTLDKYESCKHFPNNFINMNTTSMV